VVASRPPRNEERGAQTAATETGVETYRDSIGASGRIRHGKDLSMYAVEDYAHVKHVMASLS
jgi:hypothetical protein